MAHSAIYKSVFEVQNKLHDFGCKPSILTDIALAAIAARNEATPLHTQNAPGLYSYLAGVASLRGAFLRLEGWEKYAVKGVEGVQNKQRGLIILFQNVDFACGVAEPRPICPKKEGVTELVDNGTLCLFKEMAGEDGLRENKEVWFFCVSNRSEEPQAELSRPSRIEDGAFGKLLDRIYILTGSEEHSERRDKKQDSESDHDDFEVSVTKKV